MSEKVVPTLGPVPDKDGPVVGFASDVKQKKTRQAVTIESLLASIWALDAMIPHPERGMEAPHLSIGYQRQGLHNPDGIVVTATLSDYATCFTGATVKGTLQGVLAHLQEEVEKERARRTEEIDAVLRAHGTKRRKGHSG